MAPAANSAIDYLMGMGGPVGNLFAAVGPISDILEQSAKISSVPGAMKPAVTIIRGNRQQGFPDSTARQVLKPYLVGVVMIKAPNFVHFRR